MEGDLNSIMARKKTEKGKKIAQFSNQEMKKAVMDVVENGTSVRAAAKKAGLVHMTLKRYVKKYQETPQHFQNKIKYTPNYNVNKVMSEALENELKIYLVTASKMHHGLTRNDVQKLAYELAVKNNLKMPKNWDSNKKAGQDWLKGFRQRHPDLALRKPEATSLARATSFNPTTVAEFFNNLSRVYTKFENISADLIYNLDETALTTVHNPPNVLSLKGQKQVGQVTSGERGVLVTACCFINAIGNSVPPYLIFPRVHFKIHMLNGAPEGTGGNASKSGWVNGDIFVDILRHFQKYTRCSKEHPLVLIMDNHESHITIASIEFAKGNGISLVTLPPHTSGKLQPLDRTVYKSLKTHYNVVCNEWMLCNPGRTISIYEIASSFGKAYPRAFSITNIVNGFVSTGIWPLNRNVFSQDDFLSSRVTDRPPPEPRNSSNIEDRITLDQTTPPNSPEPATPSTLAPNTSDFLEKSTTDHSPVAETESLTFVGPEAVRPYPQAQPRKNLQRRKRKGKSLVLTETPIKDQIINEIQMRNEKKAKVTKTICKVKKSDEQQKDLVESSSDESVAVSYAESEDSYGELEYPELNQNEDSVINVNDYVLISESNVQNKEVVSIGQIVKETEKEYSVHYLKRKNPYFKFIKTDEFYYFKKCNVICKLPTPVPSGGTQRRAEMLVFAVDLSIYKNVLI